MRSNFADNEALPTLATDSEASGTPVVITIAADVSQFWVLDWVSWSYNDDPFNGALSISINGTVVWQVDITKGGPGHIEFQFPLYIETFNQPVVITLADGGVAGKLNVRYR